MAVERTGDITEGKTGNKTGDVAVGKTGGPGKAETRRPPAPKRMGAGNTSKDGFIDQQYHAWRGFLRGRFYCFRSVVRLTLSSMFGSMTTFILFLLTIFAAMLFITTMSTEYPGDELNANIFKDFFFTQNRGEITIIPILYTLLAAFAGGPLIAKDVKNNAISLYLSRSLTKYDYAMAKFVALFLLLFMAMGVAPLGGYAFILAISESSLDYKVAQLWIIPMLLFIGAVLALMYSTLVMTFSALSTDHRYASIGLVIVMVFLSYVGVSVFQTVNSVNSDDVSTDYSPILDGPAVIWLDEPATYNAQRNLFLESDFTSVLDADAVTVTYHWDFDDNAYAQCLKECKPVYTDNGTLTYGLIGFERASQDTGYIRVTIDEDQYWDIVNNTNPEIYYDNGVIRPEIFYAQILSQLTEEDYRYSNFEIIEMNGELFVQDRAYSTSKGPVGVMNIDGRVARTRVSVALIINKTLPNGEIVQWTGGLLEEGGANQSFMTSKEVLIVDGRPVVRPPLGYSITLPQNVSLRVGSPFAQEFIGDEIIQEEDVFFPTGKYLHWTHTTDADFLKIQEVFEGGKSVGVTLTGVPGEEDIGTHLVQVTAVDREGQEDTYTFNLTIYDPNSAPYILTSGPIEAFTGVNRTIELSAVDPDNETWNWTLGPNTPEWMGVTGDDGDMLYLHPPESGALDHDLFVSVSDGIDMHTVLINITVVDAPGQTGPGELFAFTDENLSFALEPQSRTSPVWSIEASDLANVTIVGNDLYINASAVEYGDRSVTVRLTDGTRSVNRTYNVTVRNSSERLVMHTTSLPAATEGTTFDMTMNVTNYSDHLWSLETNATWLTHDYNGRLYGIPDDEVAGSYYALISWDDGMGDIGSINMTIDYTTVNDPPVLVTIDRRFANVEEAYFVAYLATDADGEAMDLEWDMRSNGSWLDRRIVDRRTLSTDTYNRADVDVPVVDVPGTFWVNVSVVDEDGGVAYSNFTLEVFPLMGVYQDNDDENPRVNITVEPDLSTIGTQDKLIITANATDAMGDVHMVAWSLVESDDTLYGFNRTRIFSDPYGSNTPMMITFGTPFQALDIDDTNSFTVREMPRDNMTHSILFRGLSSGEYTIYATAIDDDFDIIGDDGFGTSTTSTTQVTLDIEVTENLGSVLLSSPWYVMEEVVYRALGKDHTTLYLNEEIPPWLTVLYITVWCGACAMIVYGKVREFELA